MSKTSSQDSYFYSLILSYRVPVKANCCGSGLQLSIIFSIVHFVNEMSENSEQRVRGDVFKCLIDSQIFN